MQSEQPSHEKLTVRPARSQDVAWMLTLWTAMMAEHAQQDPAFALAEDAPRIWQQSMWDIMARLDSFVFVIEPLGFCCGWVARHPAIYLSGEVGLLSEICVARGAQRRGVGRALMAAARDWFISRDVDDFQLATAMFNQQAQRFFRAMGGRPLLMRYHFSLRA